MLVLDEIAAAFRYGLLEEPEVLDAMRSLLPETEIVLSGRDLHFPLFLFRMSMQIYMFSGRCRRLLRAGRRVKGKQV